MSTPSLRHLLRRALLLTVLMATTAQAQTESEYYLRNVETGQWLGPGNTWGTQASLLPHPYWNRLKSGDRWGSYVSATDLPSGTYALESQVGNYLGYDENAPYMDRTDDAWSLNITKGADGFYTLQRNGGSGYYYGGDGSGQLVPFGPNGRFKWRIRSYDQMLTDMLDATAGSPKDATFMILDHDFSHNNNTWEAWDVRDGVTTFSGGYQYNKCGESFHRVFRLSQTLRGVPNGTYQLTAQGFYRNDAASLPVTVSFPFDGGTEGQTAIAADWLADSGVDHGSNLVVHSANASFSQTLFDPLVKVNTGDRTDEKDEQNTIYFWFTPSSGRTFTPTHISFNTTRYGTNGGLLDISWVCSDGTTVPLTTELLPARNNATPNVTEVSLDVAGATASSGRCGLRIVLYSLDHNKQVGFGSIAIQGAVDVATRPHFFINGGQQTFPELAGTENSKDAASESFLAGNYTIAPIEVVVTDNTITLGAELLENTSLWSIWDNFVLTYLGNGGSSDYGSYTLKGSPALSAADGDDWFYVEYMGAGDDEERWLGNASYYGARASLLKHPELVLPTYDAGTGTCTIQTVMTGSLGPNGSGDITDPYMDRPDGEAIAFSLEATSEADTYYLSYDHDTYYMRSPARDPLGFYYMMGNTSGKKWQIFSRQQMLEQLIQGSEEDPTDATWLIGDFGFGRNNRDETRWTFTATADGTNASHTLSGPGAESTVYCAEAYHRAFTLTQTVSGVPNGIYELRVQGFYRQDGSDDTHLPLLKINGATAALPAMEAGQTQSITGAATSFAEGRYKTDPIRVMVNNGIITLGIELQENTALWVAWDNFELTYLGNPYVASAVPAGTYFLRNVGAPAGNNWLSGGTRWGTRASLLKHPQSFALLDQGNGIYRLESPVGSGNAIYFGGDDPYNPMLGAAVEKVFPLIVEPTAAGYYTIRNGNLYYGYNDHIGSEMAPGKTVDSADRVYVAEDPNSVNAQWELLTYQQMIDIMLTGTAVSPQDATWLIKDFDFGTDNRFESAWQGIGTVTLGPTSGTDYQHKNRNAMSDGTAFTVYQTLVGIPNGKYKLRAQTAAVHGGTYGAYIFANNNYNSGYIWGAFKLLTHGETQTQYAMADYFAAEYADGGRYWTGWIEVDVVNNSLTIGASDSDAGWAVFDNFELYYIGPTAAATTLSYYGDLTTSPYTVIPRQSYLADRADALHAAGIDFPRGFLQADKGWTPSSFGKQVDDPRWPELVQNVSEYVTIHYAKQGEYTPLFLTTNDGTSASLHNSYQRWYYYDEATGLQKPMPTSILAPEYFGFVYQNGLVLGEYLHNGDTFFSHYRETSGEWAKAPYAPGVGVALTVRMPEDKTELRVGGDISRYGDMYYYDTSGTTAAAAQHMYEPSLTLRHIYKVYDAKIMAADLTARKSVADTDDDWLEDHTIHFPATTSGLYSDHVPLSLELRDYWFYRSGNASSGSNYDLQNISSDDFISLTVYYPDGTDLGIRNVHMIEAPGANSVSALQVYSISNTEMLRRRLVSFDYPASRTVPGGSQVQLLVRAHNPERNEDYNLARFTIIFDSDSETVPWMDILGENAGEVDEAAPLYSRSSESLRKLVDGMGPVAHIDFDFPAGQYYRTPPTGQTHYNQRYEPANKLSDAGSALPIDFNRTSYTFSTIQSDLLWDSQWGDYAIGSKTQNDELVGTLKVRPVSELTLDPYNASMEQGFLFIDASDLPGTVATIPFEGTLCQGSRLMCTGWMACRNDKDRGYSRMPGSVILRVMGVNSSNEEEEIYAFCPGQVGLQYRRYGSTVTRVPEDGGNYVWQQFYFDFSLPKSYPNGYVLRVENNCESTNGGDYFLDDIWVFAQVPTLEAERNTPLCGGSLDVVELQVDFATLLNKTNMTEAEDAGSATSSYLTFIYLDWERFLDQFKEGLVENTPGTYPASFTIGDHTVAVADLTRDDLTLLLRRGDFDLTMYNDLYKTTFLANLVKFADGSFAFASYNWSNYFEGHAEYESMIGMKDNPTTVFRSGEGDDRMLIFNGSFKKDGSIVITSFDFYHDYALLALAGGLAPIDVAAILGGSDASEIDALIASYDVRSQCSSRSMIYFRPKMEILGTVGAMSIDEIEFCKDTDFTFAMELTGLATAATDFEGNSLAEGDEVSIKNAWFDWWLGKSGTPATLDNYNLEQEAGGDFRLKDALRRFRLVYPEATSLFTSDIVPSVNSNYEDEPLTQPMIDYLRQLAAPADGSDPQLIIHQKVVEIHATQDKVVSEDGKDYLYFVAIPIEENVNAVAADFIYACAEPQPFRVMVNEHAPSVREGFSEKQYPAALGTLSIRIAKSQFERVRDADGHGNNIFGSAYSKLHIPLRDVDVQTPASIGVRGLTSEQGRLVRLADTSDGIMQQYIATHTSNLLPPAVGTVDYFRALRDDNSPASYTGAYDQRLAKIHFAPDFRVREGYSYTLRMYFEEAFEAETKTYAVASDFTPSDSGEQTVSSIDNGTGADSGTGVDLTYGNDGAWSTRQNTLDGDYDYYVTGNNNPKDAGGAGYKATDTPSTTRLPVTGTYYKFSAKENGMVKAAIVLNGGKPLYVVDGSTGRCLNDDSSLNLIVTDQQGIVKYLDLNNQLAEKLTGYAQFNVEAGSTYYLFSSGSKLGFYGFSFNGDGFPVTCEGTMDVILKIVPDYEVWTGEAGHTDWNNDDNWRRADYDELYAGNGTSLRNTYLPNGNPDTAGSDDSDDYNFVTAADRQRRQGFAPLYCTNILMAQSEQADAPVLYDAPLDGNGFPSMLATASALIRYDFQTRQWSQTMEDEAQTTNPNKAEQCEPGDMVTELYASNVCDKIAFQPETELVNAYHLDYRKAWVEYELTKNRWHLLASPLQDMLSGEWYAPTYSARQETTYFEPVIFDASATIGGTEYGYDRFAPAVYQRAWDKAKAVVYERGATWTAADASQTANLGDASQGEWTVEGSGDGRVYNWSNQDADEYMERLTYKPMGPSKANVAIKGTWSGVYNDHSVPYSGGGFSVMAINHFKPDYNSEAVKTLFRLPKEDTYYDIWDWNHNYAEAARVRIIVKEGEVAPGDAPGTVGVPNRGRLRSDALASAASFSVALKGTGEESLGFFLVANPFVCGLDMKEFFDVNTQFEPFYLTLKEEDLASNDDQVATYAEKYGEGGVPASWRWTDMSFRGIEGTGDPAAFVGQQVMPARYAFFVKTKSPVDPAGTVTATFTRDMMVAGRETPAAAPVRRAARARDASGTTARQTLVIRAERGSLSSEARVSVSDDASNLFRPDEDVEAFVVDGITNQIPVVYTLTGRLATSINRLNTFRPLPIGIESASAEPVTLTFSGVGSLGRELLLYDASLQTLTRLTEGLQVRVPGATQNRYFIVDGIETEQAGGEAAIQITPLAGGAQVLSSGGELLTHVRAYDATGRLVAEAEPLATSCTISLPKGVCVVVAATERCRSAKKMMVGGE